MCMHISRISVRFVNLKAVCLCVFLLLLCVTFYSYSSIHVLSVGDWPHDVLNPVYSESWIQVGWAPSLGVAPLDMLDRFDIIICDSSISKYVDHEPWKDIFDSYVKRGGTLVIIVSKNVSSSGEVINKTVLGDGKIVEVVGGASRDFWEELCKSSVGYPRFLLIQFLMLMMFMLGSILVVQVVFWIFRKTKVFDGELGLSRLSIGDGEDEKGKY